MSLKNLPCEVLIAASSHLNLQAIEQLLIDTATDFLPSLIEVFEHDTLCRLEGLQALIEMRHLQTLSREAESLHDTAQTYGAVQLMYLAKVISEAGASKNKRVALDALKDLHAQRTATIACLRALDQALNGSANTPVMNRALSV